MTLCGCITVVIRGPDATPFKSRLDGLAEFRCSAAESPCSTALHAADRACHCSMADLESVMASQIVDGTFEIRGSRCNSFGTPYDCHRCIRLKAPERWLHLEPAARAHGVLEQASTGRRAPSLEQ